MQQWATITKGELGEATTASSNHSYALFSEVSGSRDHRNNILWNARSNGSGGSAKHYAVGVNASLSGLVSDNNCLYVTGTDGVLGQEGSTNRSTLGAWQSATGLDGSSLSSDPGLVRPVANSTEVDLHIQHNSAGAAAIARAGATGTGVQYDHDGATRHSPPDIGADQILLVLADFYEEPDQPSFNYWRNKGQVVDTELNPRADVKFYTDGSLPQTYLRGGSLISFTHASVDTAIATPDTTWRVDVRFAGEKARAVDPQSVDMRDPYRNYYLPWCGADGATEVHGFGRVVYEDLYPYTDLHFYSGSGGPKLAFVIRPGGDMENIQLEFEGQDSLSVDGNGVLHAHVAAWDFPLIGGIAYQVDGGTIIPVGLTTYLNSSGSPVVEIVMSFFSSPVDPELPLVIMAGWPPMMGGGEDEGLCWSTYFGGSSEDRITASTTDAAVNYYVAGSTLSPAETFPVNPGSAIQIIGPNQITLFLSRFNNSHVLAWTNYYGAPGGNDHNAHDVAVRDTPFAIYLVGKAPQSLPLQPNGSAYLDPTPGFNNGFVARFAQNGSLVWATYFGNIQAAVHSATIDAEDRLVIAGQIGEEVPQPGGGQPVDAHVQAFVGGTTDGFVAVFDENDALLWSTCIGGSNTDIAWAARTIDDRIVVAGNTASIDFEPIEPAGGSAYNQPSTGGGLDLFAAEFDLGGSLTWGTYFGTEDSEYIHSSQAIRLNNKGDLSIGASGGENLNIVTGNGWYLEDATGVTLPQFLIQFDGVDRSRKWTTYLPFGSPTRLECLSFDDVGNLFVGGSITGLLLEPIELPGLYYQPTPHTGSPLPEFATDGFIMSFTPDYWLAWNTYFGGDDYGSPSESITTLAWRNSVLYAAGYTSKQFAPVDSYFPLFDPGGGAWYKNLFSGTPPFTAVDGFIAAFCTEILTSTYEHQSTDAPPTALQLLGTNLWRVGGLANGRYQLRLFDISGRELSQSWVQVSNSNSEPFQLNELPPDTYIAVFDGPSRVAFKIPVQR